MSDAKSSLRLAYYGDDLTGSTDALEALALAGVRALLFLEPPRSADLARHPGLEAIGVAGATRAMKTDALDATLRDAFAALGALGPCHVHYKICSTFDSSPEIGSVGRAIEVGMDIFQPAFVPVLGGAPALGRYCVFANLFARFGIGGGGQIHRLDRHPAISRHPVTPAHESDLRRQLGLQTSKRIESFDILQLGLPAAAARASLDRMVAEGAEAILFDALYPAHLDRIGELMEARAIGGRPSFSVGPSSVEAALAAAWRKSGTEPRPRFAPTTGAEAPLLVASGSCSAVTEEQITWGLAQGFAEVPIDTLAELKRAGPPAADAPAAAAAVRHLEAGRSVILHTSRGASDARVAAAGELARQRDLDQNGITRRLGAALGLTVRKILEQVKLPRVVFAGGDSSSYAARALGIESLEMIAPLTPGAPLCRVHATGSPIDGLAVVLKGGQVGGGDYFGRVSSRTGALTPI